MKRYALFLIVGAVAFSSCQKVEHGIEDSIVTINQNTAAQLQVGNTLTVNFVTNNVTSFTVAIVSAAAPSVTLLSETVENPERHALVSQSLEIPADDSWVGEHLIKVSYTAGGQTVEKTRAITFLESNPTLYLVGGSTAAGWEPSSSTPMKIYEEGSKTKFEIYTYITAGDGGFKLLPSQDGWDGNYGLGTAPGILWQDEGSGNIEVPADGFYRLRVDLEALTYELLELRWGVIGSATPGGWDSDTDLIHEGGKGSYSFKGSVAFTAGMYKFRANDDWAINLGGSLNNLTFDGPDIEITTPGTYQVELILAPDGFRAILTP